MLIPFSFLKNVTVLQPILMQDLYLRLQRKTTAIIATYKTGANSQ